MINIILQSLGLDLTISMYMRKFINTFQTVKELWAFLANCPGTNNFTNCPVTDKSEFGPRLRRDQWQMSFDNPLGYIFSISMCMQNFITIFHLVHEIGSFSVFQNLKLDKCHFAISWSRMCMQKFIKIFQTVLQLWAFFANSPGLHKLTGDGQGRL